MARQETLTSHLTVLPQWDASMKLVAGAIVTLSGTVLAASAVLAHVIDRSRSASGEYIPLAWGALFLILIGLGIIFAGWRDPPR
jgi:hypothetical protein